jgi:hypothetical protein
MRMDVRPPYVSKILRGTSNFTLDSVIKLCSAVESDFVFAIVPKNTTPPANYLIYWSHDSTPVELPSPQFNRRGNSSGELEQLCKNPYV